MNMRTEKRFFAAALGLAFAALCAPSLSAQDGGPAVYNSTGRDPFKNYKVRFRRKVERKDVKPVPVEPPSIEKRIEQYKAQKRAAMNLQQAAPKPTTALLLKEVQVTGIFRTPRGYAAMVEATPISLSYVIYPGEPFYDGTLVAIEESRLVFRREKRWTDGRRDVAVETMPLRQPNVVDSMAAQKAAEPGKPEAAADPSAKKDEAKKEVKSPASGNN